jgi:hypothetical protein
VLCARLIPFLRTQFAGDLAIAFGIDTETP